MKKIIIILFIGIILASCNNEQEEFNSELEKTVAQVNSKCPVLVDSDTRIDKVELKDNSTTLEYHYTLVNIHRQDLDTQEFRRAIWPGLLSGVKVDSDMQKLRDKRMNVSYAYFDKTGAPIGVYTVRPEHYETVE